MRTIYTNQGEFFGYIEKGYLYTYKGICVGKFKDEKIYGKNGNYLGEISMTGYLVKNSLNLKEKIEKWEKSDGIKIPMQAFQFGRIGVVSLKYIEFEGPEKYHKKE